MSDTPNTPSPPQQLPSQSLKSPQFIISLIGLGIAAAIIGRVLEMGDDGNVKLVLGYAGGVLTTILGFYVGSSQSSQRKDEQRGT